MILEEQYSASEAKNQLKNLMTHIENNMTNSIGYPVSQDFDYSELLPFLAFPINNIGDPFSKSTYKVETKAMEKEVVEFFAKLFRADKSNYWGYVTNGGSEGNLYGLYLARELYPRAVVYFSEDTHYSVQKNVSLLNIDYVKVKSQENGEIDYTDLQEAIRYNRHRPAIVVANIGTTMKEAKDDVSTIKNMFTNLTMENYYIHADAALAGGFVPFIEPRPKFDFVDGVDSISVSGHKFIGSPMPSGVVIVKKSNRDRVAKNVAYIGDSDPTITGSRNGHSPLFIWYAIKKLGLEGFKKRAQHSLDVATYAQQQLKSIGIDVWRNKNAITLVFPKPNSAVISKWQLASEKGISHLICMPNVNFEQIDAFINDLKYLN